MMAKKTGPQLALHGSKGFVEHSTGNLIRGALGKSSLAAKSAIGKDLAMRATIKTGGPVGLAVGEAAMAMISDSGNPSEVANTPIGVTVQFVKTLSDIVNILREQDAKDKK